MAAILVFGGSGAIGRAAASCLLARRSDHVVLASRNAAKLDAARQALSDSFGADRVSAWPCDVTVAADVLAVARRAVEAHGEITALLNLAGYDVDFGRISRLRPGPDSIAEAERVVDCDLLGTLRAVFAVEPHMLAAGSGTIINIGVTPVLRMDPDHLVYQVARAGVMQLTRCLAAQHRASPRPQSDVRSYCLILGNVFTPATYASMDAAQRVEADQKGWLHADRHVARVMEALVSRRLSRPDGAEITLDASTAAGLFGELGEVYVPFKP